MAVSDYRSSRMNVLYILHSSDALDGASKSFLSLLKGLMDKGIHPMVVLPEKGEINRVLQDMGVPCLVLTYRPQAYPRSQTFTQRLLFLPRLLARIYVNYKASKQLARFMQGKNISLVHTNVGVVNIGFKAAQKLGIPHIYHIREYGDLDFGIHYFPQKETFRKQFSSAGSYSICITRAIQQYLGLEGLTSSRVIYDGLLSSESVILPKEEDKYFLFAGRIEPAKGLDILLQAYHLCRQNGHELPPLWVAGRVGQVFFNNYIHDLIERYQLTDTVRFLGERKDITALMAQARALIVPSRSEGFGLCMPEAMNQHCLAIAFDSAGSKEQLDNGKQLTGEEIALRFKSVEQLADLLDMVSRTDPIEFKEMKDRAYRAVQTLYTSEVYVNNVFHFYQEILSAQPHDL